MSNSSSSSSGVGFFGLLAVLFIGLKLTNVITWSWWLVMLPLYGPVVLALIIFSVMSFILSRL
jgi:hypothetical protein